MLTLLVYISPIVLCSCFLSHIGALLGAFLAPILVIVFINTVIFIWVVVVVSQHAREKAARTNTAISNKHILRMTISISGVLFLFGLTWLFFVLTVSVPGLRETFLQSSTRSKGSLFLLLSYSQKDLTIGRQLYCHVINPSLLRLLLEQSFL